MSTKRVFFYCRKDRRWRREHCKHWRGSRSGWFPHDPPCEC